MSKLTDFINANKLDHDETFCIDGTIVKDLEFTFQMTNTKVTFEYWKDNLSPKMAERFTKKPAHMYALFTGPFTEETIEQIAELATEDFDVFVLEQKAAEELEQEAKAHDGYKNEWGK